MIPTITITAVALACLLGIAIAATLSGQTGGSSVVPVRARRRIERR